MLQFFRHVNQEKFLNLYFVVQIRLLLGLFGGLEETFLGNRWVFPM